MQSIDREIISKYCDEKFSAKQIADLLNISVSKVNYYLRKHNIQKRDISTAVRSLYITKFNKKEFKLRKNLSYKDELLKITGTMLYWGEGTKKGGTVGFSNSDPDMIKLYLKFLRRICGISEKRMKVLLHYYPDHDKNELIKYWSKITKLPTSQFTKPYVHKPKKGTYKKYSSHGTISLRYADSKLLDIINCWIKNEIQNI